MREKVCVMVVLVVGMAGLVSLGAWMWLQAIDGVAKAFKASRYLCEYIWHRKAIREWLTTHCDQCEQIADETRQREREALRTACRILARPGWGAAIGAMPEDYPELVQLRAEARREAFREAAEIARKHGAPFVNQASAIAAALEKES